jgi:hypothetical protein
MAEDKKGFLMYADQREQFDQLTDEQAGKLIKHLFSYVNDENPQTNDIVTKLSFTPIKSQLKRDLTKYRVKKEQWSAAGRASAEARKLKKEQASTNPTNVNDRSNRSTDSTVNDNVNVNVNDNVNDNVSVNDNDIKKNTKGDKPPVFMFKKSLLDYGFEKQLVEDFLKNRKTKKLTNTKTAYDSFIEEIEKTRRDKNELFKIIVQKGWGGFKSSWPIDENSNNNGAKSPHHNIVKDGDYGVL